MPKELASRRHDLDWIRVFGMVSVFVFHCARYFDSSDWHVKNAETTFAASMLTGFIVQWLMPLFFMISGMSIYHALHRRSARQFAVERVKRLLLPFLFSTLVISIPLQVWIERATHGQYAGGFLDFYPHYFEGFYAFGGNFAWMGLHLWYLEILFISSFLLLPLFLWLKNRDGLFERLGRYCRKPAGILLPAIPIILIELYVSQYPQSIGMRVFGGWSLCTYLVIFFLGFICATEAFSSAFERHAPVCLLLAGSITVTAVYAHTSGKAIPLDRTVITGLMALNCWLWLVGILGAGARCLKTAAVGILGKANEAVLPVYILHQTVIVGIGYLMLDLNTHPIIEYLLLFTASLAVIFIIYRFLIYPFDPLRVLFGLKRLRV